METMLMEVKVRARDLHGVWRKSDKPVPLPFGTRNRKRVVRIAETTRDGETVTVTTETGEVMVLDLDAELTVRVTVPDDAVVEEG